MPFYTMRGTRIYIAIGGLSLITYAAVLFLSLQPAIREPWPLEAVAGKRVWQQKGCVECHTVLGNGGYAASDLTKMAERAGRDELLAFLTRPQVVHPSGPHSLHPVLTRDEAESIWHYLEQVNKIDTQGWPPRPFAADVPAGGS
ncbi:MAG: c-type cytochrome [Thermoanaerobacteraceae bacterium]|nr:c-type cytochrome [Thermoanaerobacteraceae bacterium]